MWQEEKVHGYVKKKLLLHSKSKFWKTDIIKSNKSPQWTNKYLRPQFEIARIWIGSKDEEYAMKFTSEGEKQEDINALLLSREGKQDWK